MATKDNFPLLFKDKQNYVTDNCQYRNFTLNKNQQTSSDALSGFTKSVATGKRKVSDYERICDSFFLFFDLQNELERTAPPKKLSDFENDLQTTKKSHEWNKSTNDLLPCVGFEKEDGLKKEKNPNASTLSLHIEAYENSNDANLCNSTKEDLNKNGLIKNGLNAKQIDFDSTSVIQNAFEFPRQQENDEAKNPEVSQYRASQRLLKPNSQTRKANHQKPLPQHSDEDSKMSSEESSDSEGRYGNFQKYKKRHQAKKRKAVPQPTKTSPKKFESRFPALKKLGKNDSSDEEGENEMTIEQLIEEQKKKKPSEKMEEIEILDESANLDAAEDVAGPSTRTRSQNSQEGKKKKKNKQYQGKAQELLEEMKFLERQQKMEEKAHQDAVEYIANKIEAPVITVDSDDTLTIFLSLMSDPEFRHVVKLKHTDRFDKIYLDYGAKAGYDKPEDLTLLWDNGEEYKTIKYFDTPEKHKMPLNGTVTLVFNPKKGAQREMREEGEIKIKLNTKKEKEPLERFIHKEQPFGEFKVKICGELRVPPSKVRFTFDGEKVSDDDTPGDLEMEDFDCIDMHIDP